MFFTYVKLRKIKLILKRFCIPHSTVAAKLSWLECKAINKLSSFTGSNVVVTRSAVDLFLISIEDDSSSNTR